LADYRLVQYDEVQLENMESFAFQEYTYLLRKVHLDSAVREVGHKIVMNVNIASITHNTSIDRTTERHVREKQPITLIVGDKKQYVATGKI